MKAAVRHCLHLVGAAVACMVGGERISGSEPQRPSESARGAVEPIRLVTKTGELRGTLDMPTGAGPFPVVVMLVGSGPTDRDGNQPGLKNDSLKMIGHGLAERGIAALRYDRRGIGESRQACLKEEDLRFDFLADDAAAWVDLLRKDRRFGKVGIVGHSEGSLVGMLAAKRANADAFVSLAGTGRDAPSGLRAQLARNLPPAYKELKDKSDKIIADLAAGRTVAPVPKLLESLFRPSVQPYLISYFKYDPAREITALHVPVLLVQGTTDMQCLVDDAKLLAAAKKDAQWLEIKEMNHMLKHARTLDEQMATYTDPKVPLAPGLVEGVAEFLSRALNAKEVRKTDTHDRWLQHDIRRPKPPVIEPVGGSAAAPAPKDAMILFDGTSLDAWQTPEGGPAPWKVAKGFMEVAPGTGPIETKGKFGDVQLHFEWASPSPPGGKGQDRGNSGIFLMGVYELQVLDSYQADTYADGQAGAIYGQYPPLANASRPPGEWQTYDIAFRRPRFDKDGKLLEPARLTLTHNGILIQNNEELWGRTNWLEWQPYEAGADRGPIQLQDHGHLVRFRNIWLRELPERSPPGAEDLARPKIVSLSAEALDQFAGEYTTGPKKDAPPITISRGDGHLLFKLPSRPTPLVMQAVSPTEFVLPHTDARFTFQRDDQGRVTGVLFRVGDGERLLTKIVK